MTRSRRLHPSRLHPLSLPETTTRNIGGLPVPVLIVANKADRARSGSSLGGSLALDASLLARFCGGGGGGSSSSGGVAAGGGAYGWLCNALRGLRGAARVQGGGGSSGGLAAHASGVNLSELEGSIHSVSASAATGKLDWRTVSAFLTALWARRYQPNARGVPLFCLAVPSAADGGMGGAAAGGGVRGGDPFYSPGAAGGYVMDRQLDDDDEDRRLDDWA